MHEHCKDNPSSNLNDLHSLQYYAFFAGYTSRVVSIWTKSNTLPLSYFSTVVPNTGAFPSFGSGKWLTLGRPAIASAVASSRALSSRIISGSVGCSVDIAAAGPPEPTGLRLGLSPKIESLSSLMDEALLTRADSPSSAARRSFSRRVSRPRLWQYQKTKSRTTASQ